MKVATGTYTGNGVNNRHIDTLADSAPFEPKVVFVLRSGGSFERARCKFGSFPADTGYHLAGSSAETFSIRNLDATGFTLGTGDAVNHNSAPTYYWVAIGGEGVEVGSYVGDGVNGRQINVAFPPQVLILQSPHVPIAFLTTIESARGHHFHNDFGATGTGHVDTLNASGFVVTNSGHSNQNGETFYYAAFEHIEGRFFHTKWTGNGVDGRVIPFGFQPTMAHIQKYTDQSYGTHRYKDQVGDVSTRITGQTNLTNAIEAFVPTGLQLGNGGFSNESSKEYVAFAFADGGETVVPEIDDIQPPTFKNGDLVEVTGSNFKANQGNGKVELGDNREYAFANKKEQIIDHWEDIAIRFIVDRGELPNGAVFVFVTNDDDETSPDPPAPDPEDDYPDTELEPEVEVSGSGRSSGISTELRLERIYAGIAGHTAPRVARDRHFLMSRIGRARGINITSGMRSFEDNLAILYESLTETPWQGARSDEFILRAIEAEL